MMQKLAPLFPGLVLLIILASCTNGRYADIKAVMEKIVQANDTLVASMDKADDAKAVAAAIMTYTESIKAEQASFRDMMRKYPEVKESRDPPPELKDAVDRLNTMNDKLLTAMTKIQIYAEDEDVRAAVKKMSELQLQ